MATQTLNYVDMRALAWDADETRLAVDRDSSSLFRFNALGRLILDE